MRTGVRRFTGTGNSSTRTVTERLRTCARECGSVNPSGTGKPVASQSIRQPVAEFPITRCVLDLPCVLASPGQTSTISTSRQRAGERTETNTAYTKDPRGKCLRGFFVARVLLAAEAADAADELHERAEQLRQLDEGLKFFHGGLLSQGELRATRLAAHQ